MWFKRTGEYRMHIFTFKFVFCDFVVNKLQEVYYRITNEFIYAHLSKLHSSISEALINIANYANFNDFLERLLNLNKDIII